MRGRPRSFRELIARVDPRWLPFADAATTELPLGRLVRLGGFQVAAGMTAALLTGTLNRVMVVELGVPAALVALMVALPLTLAPFRALVGFRSDTHQSVLGWRRVPYMWFGALLQFGGLAIMPFALILLSGDTHGTVGAARVAAGLAFLLVGAGMHTVQTAGLALATDLAPAHVRPRVVALLHLLLLVGLVLGSTTFGWLLTPFSQLRLIKVVQGSAVISLALNGLAMWRQEPRRPRGAPEEGADPSFGEAWRALAAHPRARRLLVAVALGTAAFGMQDVLLEPYGGQVLALSVGSTTALTALTAVGAILALAVAARRLERGTHPLRLAASGAVVGVAAFASVLLAAALHAPSALQAGALLIGVGNGLFAVGTLTAVMHLPDSGGNHGLVLGAWGAVQATSAGAALLAGGAIRDLFASLGPRLLGSAAAGPAVAYGAVYQLEIVLLFATLAAVGTLVPPLGRRDPAAVPQRLGLAELPG